MLKLKKTWRGRTKKELRKGKNLEGTQKSWLCSAEELLGRHHNKESGAILPQEREAGREGVGIREVC